MNAPSASRRALFAGAMALPVLAAPASPDANMIALCDMHPALIALVNSESDLSDDCPLWIAYSASRDAITAWQPATVEGLISLVRVSTVEATWLDGRVDPDGTIAATWSWNVCMGLLRLHGAGRLA